MNLFFRVLIVFIILVSGLWWFFSRSTVDITEKKMYTFLIVKNFSPDEYESLQENNPFTPDTSIASVWVLYYYFGTGKFYLFEIDDDTMGTINTGFYASIRRDRNFLKEKLFEYYGIDGFDFEIDFEQKNLISFLSIWGGSSFFNLYSKTLPLGEVFINDINYKKFLQGIDNPYLRKVTALGFWYHLMMSFEDVLPYDVYRNFFLENFFKSFSSSFNYQTFMNLLEPLINGSHEGILADRIEFFFDKSSIEDVSIHSNDVVSLPYLEGSYDRNKIDRILKNMFEGRELNNLNITAQIRNATSVNRLAARAAGFFRLKGIDITEYLGFSELLERSVILDFSSSAIKRNYVKRITKIDKVYHLFHYHEGFDFSIYLGKDFYVLNNQDQ